MVDSLPNSESDEDSKPLKAKVKKLKQKICPLCNKPFKTTFGYFFHTKKYHSSGEYGCKQCKFKAEYYFDLKKHLLEFHKAEVSEDESPEYHGKSKNGYLCQLCDRRASTMQDFRKHMRFKHHWTKFDCTKCDKSYHFTEDFVDHVTMDHHGTIKETKCNSCKNQVDIQGLNSHYKFCLNEKRKKNSRQSTIRQRERRKEEPNPTKTHICDICGKAIPYSYKMIQHKVIEHGIGEYAYQCGECDYKTMERHRFRSHKKGHMRKNGTVEANETLWYFCDQCGKKLTSQDLLNKHYEKMHLGIRKDFPCKQCDKVFKGLRPLRKHIGMEHDKETEHPCHVCGKIFSYRDALTGHLSAVHPKKMWECEECGKELKTETSLKSHKRIHTGENPYKCPFCDYTCKSSGTLCAHKKFLHNGGRNLSDFPLPDPNKEEEEDQ